MSKPWLGARPGAARNHRLRTVSAGLAVAAMLLAATGSAVAAGGPAEASASRSGGTGDCDSLTTCYTPE